jgi:hypothetical protein
VPKPLDPNGLEGAFARGRPTSLDFLVPSRAPESSPQDAPTESAPEVAIPERATPAPTKKRATKKRATKKRATKKRATKKRATKKRVTKKRATKKLAAKKPAAKKPAAKKPAAKKPVEKIEPAESQEKRAQLSTAPASAPASAPAPWRPRLVAEPWSPAAPVPEARGVRDWINRRVEGLVGRILRRAA